MRPTRMGEGRLSLSHMSLRETLKSWPGFAEDDAVHWLSWNFLEPRRKAQFKKELLLTVFWPESNEEVRVVIVVVKFNSLNLNFSISV